MHDFLGQEISCSEAVINYVTQNMPLWERPFWCAVHYTQYMDSYASVDPPSRKSVT